MAKGDPEDDVEDGEAAANPNKKLIIMIVIGAFALMILSGLAVYLIMSDGGEKKPDEQEQTEQGEPQDVDEKGNPLPYLYYSIKPAFLVTLPPDGQHRMLQVSVEVMTRHQDMFNFLTDNDPMVKHHLLNLFSSQNSEELKTRAGKEKLQAELIAKIDQLAEEMGMAEAKVANVYFTKLVME
ncbi:MAG: flagellar basal body-associated FliL family protein [Gammaproteobacteria bacterium SHHR-1]